MQVRGPTEGEGRRQQGWSLVDVPQDTVIVDIRVREDGRQGEEGWPDPPDDDDHEGKPRCRETPPIGQQDRGDAGNEETSDHKEGLGPVHDVRPAQKWKSAQASGK